MWSYVAMATLDLDHGVGYTTFWTVLDGLAPGASTELSEFVCNIKIRLDDKQTKRPLA